jgi:hypothetical protein
MASPRTMALRARLDGLQPTSIVETAVPDRPNRASRRHFQEARGGKIINTVQRPTYTQQLHEYHRKLRFNAAQAKKADRDA